VLQICGITKHQYYYQSKVGKPGAKTSEHTLKIDDAGQIEEVANEKVVDQIAKTKADPETDYGYRAMTADLMLKGYIINHKKVYRLMKDYYLLRSKYQIKKRKYVRYRRVHPEAPLRILEMDIKFQWVTQHNRYAFILTILDTFTRKALAWTVAYSIKQRQVQALWSKVIVEHLQPAGLLKQGIVLEVRNDNDTRFAAKAVQQYFKENSIEQVFTHPYTPQENAHIESFHAILSRSLGRTTFATLTDLETHLNRFYRVYNQIRVHGSLDHLPPDLFSRLWEQGLIDRIEQKYNRVKFKLKVPHYLLLGNGNLREVSSLPAQLAGSYYSRHKEVNGAITLQQPLVQRQPSVVSS
jgi:transposase InsO family protein